MKTMTWFEASARLNTGDKVVFVTSVDRFSEGFIIHAGATATVVDNGLNEIWCAIMLRPDDESIREKLAGWDGNIILTPDNDGEAMQDFSPFADNIQGA